MPSTPIFRDDAPVNVMDCLAGLRRGCGGSRKIAAASEKPAAALKAIAEQQDEASNVEPVEERTVDQEASHQPTEAGEPEILWKPKDEQWASAKQIGEESDEKQVCALIRETDRTRDSGIMSLLAESEHDEDDSTEAEEVETPRPWDRNISSSTGDYEAPPPWDRTVGASTGDREASEQEPELTSNADEVQPTVELQRMACRLNVVCEQTRPGEVVALVGSAPAVGAWDPTAALELHTSVETFPTWSVEMPPLGSGTEFKLIIKSSDGNVAWEPLPTNRLWDATCEVTYAKYGVA